MAQSLTPQQIADLIERTFIPFAFTCSCTGQDPSCAEIRDDESTLIRYYHTQRIIRYFREMP